ncbi:hypothetical protein [Nonomuraea sp. NPDC046570]|uniref:hypothetical protein n=1 Tax=Nonomuraea sp. NPDC046570 TaxID=3155255 RepID=UPI0033ECFC8F
MNVVYAYPWDIVGDPAAPERFAGLGVDAVALAASYHSVRAATPFHPGHRLVNAHAACYVPVRPTAWGRLAPATPSWTAADAFVQARDALKAVGLAVHAWTVFTHNSHLGSAHPDLVVRNAFGDLYPYALCPAQPDVVEYCRTLAREIVLLGEPDAVILEACGPLGFRHGGPHEKTDGADWSPVQADLLSLCFCTACAKTCPDGLGERVRAGIDGSPASVEAALGDLAPAVRDRRTALTADLQRAVVAEVRGLPVTVHATAHPWAAGAFTPHVHGVRAEVLVANCWGDPDADTAGLRRLRALAGDGVRVGAYVLALPPRSPAALKDHLARYAEAGAEEFHLYHGGLASRSRLDALAAAVGARPKGDAAPPIGPC